MNTVLMYVTVCLVCRFKAPGGGFRNLKFDPLYKYIYTHKACSFKNLKFPTGFNLVPLTKESRFPKEQSL